MVTTDDPNLAQRMRIFRNHGITSDHRQRQANGSWFYEMVELGYNYRLTDIQCALGISQLKKLPKWLVWRQEIARQYDHAFSSLPEISPLEARHEVSHAYHLYVVKLEIERLKGNRAQVFAALRAEGVGVNVHYIPVPLHPFYRKHFGTKLGDCPVAENAYERIISLPIFPMMSNQDVEDVITAVSKVTSAY